MSARTPSQPPVPARRGRRRTLLAGLLAVLLLAGVAGWIATRGGSDPSDPPPAAAATSSSAVPTAPKTDVPLPSETPTSVPSAVLASAPGLPDKLTPVALVATSDYGTGVSARLVSLKTFDAQAHGAGETSGAALTVTVELTNTTGAPVALDTVAVNLYRGATGIPASRVQSESGLPFSGSLAPGGSAQAVYAFSVPQADRDVVTVTVGYTPDAGTAVFSGPVS